MSSSKIVIVGSCMIDFTSYVEKLPKEGETIHGSKFVTAFGGKGANQCVAAAKLGGSTCLVARVGDDVWGQKYIQNLNDHNIRTQFVKITERDTTGIAQINVAKSGANQIVIVAAANKALSVNDVEEAEEVIVKADVVVCQLETNPKVAISAIKLCRGISVLNGAPALANCDERLLSLPSIFCVNESELEVFTGASVNNLNDAKKGIQILLDKGCKSVIVTVGSQGALFASKDSKSIEYIAAPKVTSVDTTGAGDAFIGALAYCLAYRTNLSLKEIIRVSNYVAADSVTRLGTQLSFPESDILEKCT